MALGDGTALVETDAGGAPDLVAVVTEDGTRPLQPRLTLVRAGFDGEVRWRRLVDPEAVPTVLEVEAGIVLLNEVTDPLTTLVPGPTDLVALDADDGAVAWRTTVAAAAIPWIAGDRVIVPEEDGAVLALDVATGEEAWSLADPANTSTEAPRIRTLDDDTVLVSRTRPDDGIELVPVALEDGTEGPAFGPACDRGTPREERAFDSSRVVPVPGTTDAVAVFGQAPQCVQRWDTTMGEPRWTTTTVATDDIDDRAPFPRSIVLDGDHLAFDGAEGIVLVDLDGGAHRVLERADGDAVAPLFVIDGSVVAAEVDDDGAHPELDGWAVDATAPRWDSVRVGGEEDAEDAVLVADRRGATTSSDAGGAAVQAESVEGVIRTIALDGVTGGRVGTLDPATGEVTERPFRLHPDRTQRDVTTVSTIDIEGDRGVVIVTGLPHLVDLATGEVVAAWPDRAARGD